MLEHKYSADYDDPLIAELYDQHENYTDDVELIRRLIADLGKLRILEVFSGTGRIVIPLAQDGHELTGIEIAPAMNERLLKKAAGLAPEVQSRITLISRDALEGSWGKDFDLVIIGANALYELASVETQKRCVELASQSLIKGGHLFLDNNDYKGNWDKGPFGEERIVFEGFGQDGSFGRWSTISLRFDETKRILYLKRIWYKRLPDGSKTRAEYLGKKRPVDAEEITPWLKRQGFEVKGIFGDRKGNPYGKESDRAIFWARKKMRPAPTRLTDRFKSL